MNNDDEGRFWLGCLNLILIVVMGAVTVYIFRDWRCLVVECVIPKP